MAATAEDLARLVVSIEFTQKQAQKQLAAIAKNGADTAGNIEKRFQKANDNVGKSFDNGGKKVVQSLGAQRAAVSNLSFQLNDIAMGLASGTSPFTIMVQQGSQVSQALQGSGGILGAVKTLGGAFATMVNPVSLASFALIGLTGVAVQYLTTLSSGVPDSDKLLKEHAELIKSFDEAWGVAEKGVKEYSEATKQVELQKLRDEFGDLSKVAAGAFDKVTHGLRQIPASEFGGGDLIDQTNRAMYLLEQQVPALREFAAEMVKIENAKGVPTPVREAAEAARKLAQELFPVQDALEETQKKLNVIRLSGDQAKEAFAALTAQAMGLGVEGGGAITTVAGKIKTDLIPAMTTAIQQVAEFAKNYRTLQDQVNQTPLGQLSPVFSGGGDFLNPDQLQTFNAGEERYKVAGESAAASMVKGFESFISKAKWDVNAYRVGFGSDTVTRANGDIEQVTKDTIVTLDDAQRDLSRRLVEFQDGIQSAIGTETWKSLNDGQQAALTSIAYNYGSLPKRIVEAIQNGGGPEAVAQAIAALGGDNGGINKNRRQQEAQSYLNGTGVSLKEAGIGGKSPSDIFKGDVQQVQARIDALNAEYAAQAQLNPLVNDYGYAVEKARIEQQLLSEAQKAGLEITPALREQISGLAENYAKASVASEQLQESQKRTAEAAKAFNGLGKEALSGFISDMRRGVSASEALSNALNRVLDKLIDIGIESLFSGAGGGGGLLGGLFGSLFGFADGGIAAHGKPLKTFARGGVSRSAAIFGEAGPEAAVPLPDGRSIPVKFHEPSIPKRSAGTKQNVHVTVGVSADNNGNLLPFVQSVSEGSVQKAAPSIVQAANQNVVPTMARHQANKAGGDWR